MAKVDRAYVTMGLALLVVGMLLGLHMGASGDNTYLDVHVALLLGGFVLLTTYGLLYRMWPQLKGGALVKAQFGAAAVGAVTIPVGAFLVAQGVGVAVAAGGSVFAIIGAVLML